MAPFDRIKKRPEYLAVADTQRKWVTPAFIVQAMPGESDEPPRAGFTVSKKVGNAVARNRARRRLKEVARAVLPAHGTPGWAYVFIGRQAAISYDFEKLGADMRWALAKLASGADLKSDKRQARRGGPHNRSKGK
ncbi:ribonuclease P protein component [Kordiimonas aestuarii]|uniref:ribonuclease P protein component n=1 Tax=Kordiimonas aestuarii TaxID=1005925 RepID=UPI0021D21B04|nr:ribonuclease P protein component [Kordiimonas aestuarii]